MPELLTERQRLEIVADLCPRHGQRRPCDSAELARAAIEELIGPPERAGFTADLILMRATDRYVAGELSIADLYRCRVLAYYLVFARGGEEWTQWGIAAAVRPGDFDPEPSAAQLADLPDPIPPGPPWRAAGKP